MSTVEYTQEYLLDRMSKDSRLSDQEKCEMLFGLSYGDGNGVSKRCSIVSWAVHAKAEIIQSSLI